MGAVYPPPASSDVDRTKRTAFMAELEAPGGDFTRLSDVIAARDGGLPVDTLLADLRSPALHGWEPPGGGSGAR